MKKLLCLLMALVMVVAVFAACGSSEPAKTPDAQPTQEAADDPYAGITPLKEKVKIRYAAILGGSTESIPIMAEQLGAWEKANIDFECITFGNGPVIVEAMSADSWDVSQYGIGGMAAMVAQDVGIFTAPLSSDTGMATAFFAHKDTAVAKAGKGQLADYPELYADKDAWKGAEIYLPTGTTIHYLVGHILGLAGVDMNDVKLVHMDAAQVNTAMIAGSAKLGGLWRPLSFNEDLLKDFVVVGNLDTAKLPMDANHVVTEKAWKEKKEAVLLYYEIFARTVDWFYASEENFNQGAQWYLDWNIENGQKSDLEGCKLALNTAPIFTVDDWYEKSHTNTTYKGIEMTQYQQSQYGQLEFFVEQGKYGEEVLKQFFDQDQFTTEVVDEIL